MYSAPQLRRLIYCMKRPCSSLIIYKYKSREEIAFLIDFGDANLRFSGFKYDLAMVLVPYTLEKTESHLTPNNVKNHCVWTLSISHSPLSRHLEVPDTKEIDKQLLGIDSAVLDSVAQMCCQRRPTRRCRVCWAGPGRPGSCWVACSHPDCCVEQRK